MAALPAHRRWLARFETARRAKLVSAPRRDRRQHRDPVRRRRLQADGAGRPHRAARRTAATPSSTTRPARRRPRSRCAPDCRRSSRSKPRSCARAASRTFPAGATVGELVYVRLRGGAVAGEEMPIEFKNGTPDEQADHALARLAGLLAKFADPATPYYSLLHPMWATHYGNYDHLARVQEWSLIGDDERRRSRSNEQAARHPGGCHRAADRRRRTRTARPGSRPMPAPARPTCWRSA